MDGWRDAQKRLDELAARYKILARQREVLAALAEAEPHLLPANDYYERCYALRSLVASEILVNVGRIWQLSGAGRADVLPVELHGAT